VTINSHYDEMIAAEEDVTLELGKGFDAMLKSKFGYLNAPTPYITPFGIVPLDILLGGGLPSSEPVLLNSTPETGKSTFAYQFSKSFQTIYPNGIVVYLDTEGGGGIKSNEVHTSRMDIFGLNNSRFRYNEIVGDTNDIYELISSIVELKKAAESKFNKEFKLLIILDSITKVHSSKGTIAKSQNEIIGLKSREVSLLLEKLDPILKFNKVTFLCIDQVRAHFKIDGPWIKEEKSTGMFRNRGVKSATGTFALQHNSRQWLFLSKMKNISLSDGIGIDGWELDIYVEKNKLAPSKHSVTCIFDKNKGIDKFWSEYEFIANPTESEKKMYKKKKPDFPMMIKKKGSYVYLSVSNPDDPTISYKSDSFYRKDAKKKYNSDKEFKKWFDYAVAISSYHRIINGMFKYNKDEVNMAEKEQIEAARNTKKIEEIELNEVKPPQEIKSSNNGEFIVQE